MLILPIRKSRPQGLSYDGGILSQSFCAHTHPYTQTHTDKHPADPPAGTIGNLTEAKLKLAMEPPKDGEQVINVAKTTEYSCACSNLEDLGPECSWLFLFVGLPTCCAMAPKTSYIFPKSQTTVTGRWRTETKSQHDNNLVSCTLLPPCALPTYSLMSLALLLRRGKDE